jgi:hypothetical protein
MLGPALVAMVLAAAPIAAAPAVHVVLVGDAAIDQVLRDRLAAAGAPVGLSPPELATLAGPPAPQAPAALASATRALDQLEIEPAIRALDLAASDAAVTGGAGLDATALGDIYLLRAVAAGRATRPDPQRAWEDFVRAATLTPERLLDGGRFPPAVLKEWKRATAEVARRPRGTLVVRAPLEARISIDARSAGRSPAVAPGLPFGQHLVRVEEPGRLPWGTVVSLAAPTLELEVPPRAALTLDDRTAAGRGRAAGARFVLLAQPRVRGEEALVELALIEVASELRRDSQLVDLATPGALEAAVRRLADAATPLAHPSPHLVAVEPARPAERSWLARPATWVAVAALVAGAAAAAWALSRGTTPKSGFSSALDPSHLGQ